MDYLTIYSAIQGALACGISHVGNIGAVASYNNKNSDENPESIDIYIDRLRIARLQKTDSSSYKLLYKPHSCFVDPLSEQERGNVIRACHELTGCTVAESDERIYID